MVKISIIVMATAISPKYANQIQACLDTWVKDADENNIPVYFFAGYHQDKRFPLINLPGVQEDYQSAFHKQFHGLKWVYDKNKSDFYMIVGTDTFINIKNLIQVIDKYNYNDNLFIGNHGHYTRLDNEDIFWHSGGCGFILSNPVLDKIFNVYNPEQIYKIWARVCQRNNVMHLLPACDVTMAWLCNLFFIPLIYEDYFYGCSHRGRYFDDSQNCDNPNCKYDNNNLDKIVACHFMSPNLMTDYYNYLKFKRIFINNYTVVTSCSDDNVEYDAIFRLPTNMVIFCNKRNYSKLEQIRTTMGMMDSTKLILSNTYDNCNNIDVLKYGINNNNFKSEYYAWISYDIQKFISDLIYQVSKVLQNCNDYVSMLYYSYNKVDDRFITGPKNILLQLDEDVIQFYNNNPDKIKFYYGDKEQILLNYSKINCNTNYIIQNIADVARSQDRHKFCYDCIKMVIDSILNKAEFNIELLVKLIDDYYISAFYLGYYNQCLNILKLHLTFTELYQDQYLKYLNPHLHHIINNSDFLINHIDIGKCIAITNDNIDNDILQKYILDGYKVFIYGKYELNTKSLICNNPVYRPRSKYLNIKYSDDIIDIPVYIIAFNNLYHVKNMVQQLEKYTTNINIIDNCSTYTPLLSYYTNEYKYKLMPMDKNYGPHITFHKSDMFPNLYIITDPDLQLNENLPSNFINILYKMMLKYKCSKVGFALDISELDKFIPGFYHHSKNIIEWENQFWQQRINNDDLELYWAQIDTTFCIVDKNNLCGKDVRIAGNFTCKHLPWYNNHWIDYPNDELDFYRKGFKSTIINLLFNSITITKNNINIKINNIQSDLNFWQKEYDKWNTDIFNILDKYLDQNKIFIDLSNNLGQYSIYALYNSKLVYGLNNINNFYFNILLRLNDLYDKYNTINIDNINFNNDISIIYLQSNDILIINKLVNSRHKILINTNLDLDQKYKINSNLYLI